MSELALALIRSSCAFWFSSSPPMSFAMFLRLPIIAETCSIFSSISSSRASLVILATNAPLGISTPGWGGAPPPGPWNGQAWTSLDKFGQLDNYGQLAFCSPQTASSSLKPPLFFQNLGKIPHSRSMDRRACSANLKWIWTSVFPNWTSLDKLGQLWFVYLMSELIWSTPFSNFSSCSPWSSSMTSVLMPESWRKKQWLQSWFGQCQWHSAWSIEYQRNCAYLVILQTQ